MSFILDGNFDFPREVDQSPRITIDEVTYSMVINRRYAVLTTAYKPLPQASIDPIYKSAVLVSEQTESIQGPITFFTRTYAVIPSPRTEYRQVPFTRPGVASVTISTLSGFPIAYDPYGAAAPSTRVILASVTFTYSLSSLAGNGPISNILYKGAPVDFVGTVYTQNGTREVSLGGGRTVTEPNFVIEGFTAPGIIPLTWVHSVNVTRWKGPIWQAERIVVSTTP